MARPRGKLWSASGSHDQFICFLLLLYRWMRVCDHVGTTTEDIYSACKDGDELYVKQWANHPENDINSTLVMVDLLYTVPTAARYGLTSPFHHYRHFVLSPGINMGLLLCTMPACMDRQTSLISCWTEDAVSIFSIWGETRCFMLLQRLANMMLFRRCVFVWVCACFHPCACVCVCVLNSLYWAVRVLWPPTQLVESFYIPLSDWTPNHVIHIICVWACSAEPSPWIYCVGFWDATQALLMQSFAVNTSIYCSTVSNTRSQSYLTPRLS